ncbi:3-hydroxyacyl-ACP dehydratase FabZ family protein [Prosthecobacter vanneervenii]|uniref:3-hydroxymyristoyl/3-hydroxydecanoyl-(Acyl carrier protein) dehydratase n=1 Tax=Prosthecobacter vanneervenii TaxID=48466 RepID=A0A7W7YET3_9BACT|nr:3-hydroxyacyl-ACP dehydratase FabZ family protein [Prosthecobacter vanneervenii]MBB5034858.1 3-hydroxymyristoyl/3-hydroxydecanoyl-(acyl carrier protein) dehydratase [Prosthecobacter vanneervenii]
MTSSSELVQALSSLPHGSEFRFIDEIVELIPGTSAKALWRLKGDEEFLKGHFPGAPLMPGVLMIEALAQLGGILLQTRPGEPVLKNLRLTAVRQIKILGSITPGHSLHLSATLQGVLDTLGQVSGEIRDDAGNVILTGAVTLAGER